MKCLDNMVIAFVGDSHVRNSYRCLADMLTSGGSKLATGRYSEAWNEPGEPENWPKYSHIFLEERPDSDPGGGLNGSDSEAIGGHLGVVPEDLMHTHELSCRNQHKVHRHDYSFTVRGSGGTNVRLDFYWLPWGGDRPLIETTEAVDQMGLPAAEYR
jgi:hypothetical protein